MRHPLRDLAPDPDAKPPWMDHTIGGGQYSQYTPQMAAIILARIEAGQTVRQVAADPDMPSYRTIYDWVEAEPDFGEAWTEMRRERAHARREAIIRREPAAREAEARRALAEGRKPRRKTGRKSTWTRERGEAFCALIDQGLSTRAACARPGMPDPPMVHRWLRNHPQFRECFVRAVRFRELRLADEVWDLALQATPANVSTLKPRVKRMQARVSAMRPAVWRWD
jgi:hypothetical protein